MISNQSSIKNESNVQIGEIKIETQATNGAEVVKEIKKSYTEQEAKNISQNHLVAGGCSYGITEVRIFDLASLPHCLIVLTQLKSP